MKKLKKAISKLFNNNWFITLTATLIGVFAALYLSEQVSSGKLKKQKMIATKNVLSEISFNKEKMERSEKKHIKMLEIMTFMDSYVDWENETFIIPADSLRTFQLRQPNTFIVEDSTFISKGIYEYNGELNLDLSLPELEITTIAWKTLKDSGISGTYGFECLLHLETVYKLTNEVSAKNGEILNLLIETQDMGKTNTILISKLNYLTSIEKSLIEMLSTSEQKLNNCG